MLISSLYTMKIFLSHASSDKATVERIIDLITPPLEVWLDKNDIAWADRLDEVIKKAIDSSEFFIIAVSETSLHREWVQKELLQATTKEQDQATSFILPILFPGISEEKLDPSLEGRLYLRLDGYTQSDYNSLASKIKDHILRLVLQRLCLLEQELNNQKLLKRRLHHVIAWEGMEAPLSHGASSTDLPDREFLLIRGSLEQLPWLSFRHSGKNENEEFITLVCDIEYLFGYKKHGRIREIANNVTAQRLINMIDTRVKSLAKSLTILDDNSISRPIGNSIFKLGIPIRFGFQEILVNVDRVKRSFIEMLDSQSENLSYRDLPLEVLLSNLVEGFTLGLWSVPHATLSVLALLEEYPMNESIDSQDYQMFWRSIFGKTTLKERMDSAVKKLLDPTNLSQWEIVDSPASIWEELSDSGNVGIMIGAGSWALPEGGCIRVSGPVDAASQNQDNGVNKIIPLLPKEGLLGWIDCAAILDERKHNVNDIDPFSVVNYWLKHDAQLNLSSTNNTLRACPVTRTALSQVSKDKHHPSIQALNRFINNPNYVRLRPMLQLSLGDLWGELQNESTIS